MNPILQKNYLTDMFPLFKEEYHLLKYSASFRSSFYYVPDNHMINMNFRDAKELKTLSDFLENTNPVNVIENQARTGLNDFFIAFYIDYFIKHPEIQQDLLKFFNNLTHKRLTKYNIYSSVLPVLFKDKQQLISAIHGLPVKNFTLGSEESLKEFKTFLGDIKLTDFEQKKFFLTYFKNRIGLLKSPLEATHARNFVLELHDYDKEELTPYFSFMPFVHNYFQEQINAHDIFNKKAEQQIFVDINLKTMLKVFTIDYATQDSYKTLINSFATLFCEHYHCKTLDIYSVTKNKDMVRIIIDHKNPELTNEFFKTKLIDFTWFIKAQGMRTSVEEQKIWFLRSELENALPVKKELKKKIKV